MKWIVCSGLMVFCLTASADEYTPVVGAKCDDNVCLEAYLTPLLVNTQKPQVKYKRKKRNGLATLKQKFKKLVDTKYDLGYGMDFGIHDYVKGFDKRSQDIGIARSLTDSSSVSFNLRKPGINWMSDQKDYQLNFRLAADDDSKEKAQILFGISSEW